MVRMSLVGDSEQEDGAGMKMGKVNRSEFDGVRKRSCIQVSMIEK
jgi:hypothetical protein